MDKTKQIIVCVCHMQLHLNHVHNSHTLTHTYEHCRKYVKQQLYTCAIN